MAPPGWDMPFSKFCAFLDSVRGKGYVDIPRKRQLMTAFFSKICEEVGESKEEFKKSTKDIMSILMSDSNEARKLDMGEKKLTALVSKVVGMTGLSSVRMQGAGSVAEKLAEEVTSRLGGTDSGLSVSEVCARLDSIAQNKGNSQIKEAEVEFFAQHCSKPELLWLFNTMMRNVESYMGLSRKVILESIAPEGNDAWKHTRDLNRITSRPSEATDPDFFLGVNFCPMLLARLSQETIEDQVTNNLKGGFFMEIKFDGEHVIMHKKGTNYKWFTRNGKDFTEYYGSHSKEKLADRIHNSFKASVEECILDCELMHYDEKTRQMVRHLEKGSGGVTLNYRAPQPGHRIVVVVFDMLYFAGKVRSERFQEDLMRTPLSDRVEIMTDRLLKKNDPSNIFIPERAEGTTGDDIREFYEQATKAKEEGIAVKRKDSLYFIGERAKRNGWFKLKEMFDMDLVIVGYMPAKDDRGSAFLLAAWDDSATDGVYLHVICKSYSGLKDLEREKIMDDARTDGKLLKEPPECLTGWKGDLNYLYFRSNDYVVVEAKAYGLRNGSLIDVVMRRVRSDKSICKEDIDDYRTIKRHQAGHNDIPSHMDEPSTSSTDEFKTKRVTKRGIFATGAVPSAKRPNVQTETSLTGRTVCVLPSFDEKLRKKCWSLLESYGAKVIATPNDQTDFVVAPSENHMRTKTVVKKGTLSVVKGDWLTRCETEGEVKPWLPNEMILEVPGAFGL